MKIIRLPYKKANKPTNEVSVKPIKIKKSVGKIDIDSLDKCLDCDKINCICNEKEKSNIEID